MNRLVAHSPILGPALGAPYFSEEASAGESCLFSSLSSGSSMQGLGGFQSHCGHPWLCAPSHLTGCSQPSSPKHPHVTGQPSAPHPNVLLGWLEEEQALPNNHNECSHLILDTWAGGSQREVISAKGGNHAPLRGFFCTNGWGKRNLCFFLKPSSPIAQGSDPTQRCVSFPTPCPVQQPNAAACCPAELLQQSFLLFKSQS